MTPRMVSRVIGFLGNFGAPTLLCRSGIPFQFGGDLEEASLGVLDCESQRQEKYPEAISMSIGDADIINFPTLLLGAECRHVEDARVCK